NHRLNQAKFWMYQTITESLRDDLFNNPMVKSEIKKIEAELLADRISSFVAAKKVLEFYKSL
ncbi:MAG: methylmalonyl Co-A mutase-associated GTPase MeaB, partial [Bacteroidales bacterium]|nr:methylmalonyl Co-A mutase-associated GTPase MeaB [Bacteroidales bacterium]